jgi:hypothetical protein
MLCINGYQFWNAVRNSQFKNELQSTHFKKADVQSLSCCPSGQVPLLCRDGYVTLSGFFFCFFLVFFFLFFFYFLINIGLGNIEGPYLRTRNVDSGLLVVMYHYCEKMVALHFLVWKLWPTSFHE